MSRVNLETCFPLGRTVQHGLPVLVDLNWIGTTMTSDNAGIIPSRATLARPQFSLIDSAEVVL